MSDEPQTVFKFTGEGVDLEFAGSETFVEKQVEHFRRFLEGAAGISATAAVAPPAPEPKTQTINDFADAHPVRRGRGAIQDRILLYTYFLQHVQGKTEVRSDDIHWCFQQLEQEKPKNLHNALGLLKRKLALLQEGSGRGLYQLSPKGTAFVEGQFLGK